MQARNIWNKSKVKSGQHAWPGWQANARS